jgi:ParB-like nuclease domain
MMETQPMLCGNGFAVSRNLNPDLVRVETLKPLGRETRKHPPAQIRKLQASIEQFGFVLPIVIDATSRVIAGWGLALAAKKLGLPEVPAVTITDLDEAKLRMLRLALNRLSEDSRWDLEALRLEFSDMMEMSGEIDLRISGFEMGDIDVAFDASGSHEEDDLPARNETSTPVTKPGDLWLPGQSKYDLRRPRPRQGCNSSNDGERTLRAGRNHDARRHYRMATGRRYVNFSRNGFFDER